MTTNSAKMACASCSPKLADQRGLSLLGRPEMGTGAVVPGAMNSAMTFPAPCWSSAPIKPSAPTRTAITLSSRQTASLPRAQGFAKENPVESVLHLASNARVAKAFVERQIFRHRRIGVKRYSVQPLLPSQCLYMRNKAFAHAAPRVVGPDRQRVEHHVTPGMAADDVAKNAPIGGRWRHRPRQPRSPLPRIGLLLGSFGSRPIVPTLCARIKAAAESRREIVGHRPRWRVAIITAGPTNKGGQVAIHCLKQRSRPWPRGTNARKLVPALNGQRDGDSHGLAYCNSCTVFSAHSALSALLAKPPERHLSSPLSGRTRQPGFLPCTRGAGLQSAFRPQSIPPPGSMPFVILDQACIAVQQHRIPRIRQ